MGKKEASCACGGSFDANGICTECGKKRPRSGGYRVFHGILIVIASLIVLGCLSSTLCIRHYILYQNISNGLRESRLSDFTVPFQDGQTITDMLRKEYVTDERVLPEDIAGAIDEVGATGYLAGKMDEMGKMLRGETDTYPSFSSDEIVKLLEQSESSLYSKCMLIIEAQDKADIRAALDEPLAGINSAMDTLYGSKAGRFLARFRVSVWRAVLDLVLLGLLLWRWIKVRRNAGRSGCGAVRGMGWVFFVPSVLILIGCAVTALMAAFKSDSVVGLYALIKGIRTPHWLLAPLTAAFGIFLMTLATFIQKKAIQKREKLEAAAERERIEAAENTRREAAERRAATFQERPAAPASAPAQSAPVQTAPAQPVSGTAVRTAAAQPAVTTQTTAKPAQPAASASVKRCISCGKEIPERASFCIHCGANQKPAQPAAERDAEIDGILRDTPVSAPAVKEPAAPLSDTPADDTTPMRAGLDAYLKNIESESGENAD
ncbi:MAG: zinc-ribbon domain-containing protein [Oscillospiraceae bacterium]|nr:zinc-ribbon domain-containing protein [Oscillospiraceae bacterium]